MLDSQQFSGPERELVIESSVQLRPGAFVMLPIAFQSSLQAKPLSHWECRRQTEL